MNAETVTSTIETRFADLWDRKETARLHGEWGTYQEYEHRLEELDRLYNELVGDPVPLKDDVQIDENGN